MDYRVIAGKNQIVNYSDINFSVNEQFTFLDVQNESLAFFIKTGLKSKAIEHLEAIFNENSLGQKAGIDSIRVMASNIVSEVLNIITEIGISIPDIFENSMQPFHEVFKLDTFPEMKDYLKKLMISFNLCHR